MNNNEGLFNKKELLSYCTCLSKKLNMNSLKSIDKSFYTKCIKKSKKESNKRLTKLYTLKYKKSLQHKKTKK